MTTFVRVLEAPVEGKPTKLLYGIRQASGLVEFPDHVDRIVLEVDPEAFSLILGNPFAYWVNDKVRSVFTEKPAPQP